MSQDNLIDARRNSAERFIDIFYRLLAGQKLDLYQEGASSLFQLVATNLMMGFPERKYHYYDGVDRLTARIRKARQIEFNGEMWVGGGQKQWKENFRTTVTDKRSTKQGIWIMLYLGTTKAAGEVAVAFGIHIG